MDYTELTTNIEDICENTFTADQLAMFAQQAEQKIYNTVQFPALRKNSTGSATLDNRYLSVPSDFLYTHSLAVIDGSGNYIYLLVKDANFIREAYPNPTATGTPKHYGQFDEDSMILGPTPDANYDVELHYGYYPESIVTAGTTWLGDNFDSALLNGALVEALRFMKGEEDLVAMYDKFYMHAITLLKTLGDGKLRQDSYRDGQAEVQVG
jgi:hypothetical protein